MSDRRIPLAGGLIALVDEADYERVVAAGTWCATRQATVNYAQRSVYRNGARTSQMLHTFITGWPMVDHKNGDGLDNRRENLRQSTPTLNMANRRRPRTNTSGFKGVDWIEDRKKWRARIRLNGRNRHLGYFLSAEAAADAYDAAAVAQWGEFALLNSAEGDR